MSAFSDICEKIITTANSEAHFSEARAERILEQFWVDFGTLFGGLGHPKWEKMRSKNDAKKRVAKKSREGVQVNPVSARAGRGCPINNPPGALFQPYGHSPRAARHGGGFSGKRIFKRIHSFSGKFILRNVYEIPGKRITFQSTVFQERAIVYWKVNYVCRKVHYYSGACIKYQESVLPFRENVFSMNVY